MKKRDMVPLKEFAEQVDIPYTTLIRWVKAGKVKGARFQPAPTAVGGYWLVPESAANNLPRPRLGRPPKAPKGKALTKPKQS